MVLCATGHFFTPSSGIGLLIAVVGVVLWLFGDRIAAAFRSANCGNCGRCLRCSRR